MGNIVFFLKEWATPLVAVGTFLLAIATLTLAVYTARLWREARSQRIAMQKPLLTTSSAYSCMDSSKNLFVANYVYPRMNSFKLTKLYYIGLRNIGNGPALHAKVRLMRIGTTIHNLGTSKGCHIEKGEVVPLVIRLGYNEFVSDLEHTMHQIIIDYGDSLGNNYILNLCVYLPWSNKDEVIEAVPLFTSPFEHEIIETGTALHRYAESQGFFELKEVIKHARKQNVC